MDKSEVPTARMSVSRLRQKRKTGCLCTRQIVEISNKDGYKLTGSTERGGGIHDQIRRSFVDLIDRYVLLALPVSCRRGGAGGLLLMG